MYLVDTSVWINHFRSANTPLTECLTNDLVACHPFIIGELALGSLKNRMTIITILNDLPHAPVADNSEVMAMIETRHIYSQGIGFIDAHLLASAMISGDLRIWTADKRLATLAGELNIAARLAE